MIVLYGPAATVAELSGEAGLRRAGSATGRPEPRRGAGHGRSGARLPRDGRPGSPVSPTCRRCARPATGRRRADTEDFAKLLGVITVLALLSAMVLISNTMSTLVAEQTREIGIMRAVGARRRQVALVYLRTTLLFGAAGALVGIALGIVLSSLLARSFGPTFWAVDVGFGVDLTVVLVSALVGLAGAAARRRCRRSGGVFVSTCARRSRRAAPRSAAEHAADRLLRRAAFLPRTMQIGLRNIGRRKRRSLATAFDRRTGGRQPPRRAGPGGGRDRGHAHVLGRPPRGPAGLHRRAGAPRRARRARDPRDARVWPRHEPVLKNAVELAGQEAFVWALDHDPLFRYRLTDGRWFDAGEQRGPSTSRGDRAQHRPDRRCRASATRSRSTPRRATPSSASSGSSNNQQENGTALYVPLDDGPGRCSASRPAPGRTGSRWSRPSRHSWTAPPACSRTDWRRSATRSASEITYVAERDEVAANRSLTTSIAVLGFVIVAMSMVGLANAITTNVLERTREIGILRSIGARARDVRRIFTTEGVTLAIAGWLLGIPLGYALTRLLVWLVWEVVDVRLPVVFPPWNILTALVGTVALALLVLTLPVRRAVRFRPGDALRYA